MSSSDISTTRPRVLFVYFTYTQQSLRVVEAMSEVLRERGCNVAQARIGFTDDAGRSGSRGFPSGMPSSTSSGCSRRSSAVHIRGHDCAGRARRRVAA